MFGTNFEERCQGRRCGFMTALRRLSHHILLYSTYFLTFTPSIFLHAGILACESLRGSLIPCCGGLARHDSVAKGEFREVEAK